MAACGLQELLRPYAEGSEILACSCQSRSILLLDVIADDRRRDER